MESQKKTTIISLSIEIIEEEILPRLPVKSLLKFRCVSKSWRSLIGSKGFIKTHHQNSIQNPSFSQKRVIVHCFGHGPKQYSLQSLLNEPSPLDNPTNIRLKPYRFLGCYNGLVCILEVPRTFYLWNLSTRISKKLPETFNGAYVRNSGFGWVESSGEYKVFALVYSYRRGYDSKVYSSKTKSWKTIEHSTDLPSCWPVGAFVGGKLHWVKNYEDEEDVIVLDLKSEVFGRIELPCDEVFCTDGSDKCLGEIGGCLCVLYYNPADYCGRGIRVWVMKESWERVVDLPHLLELPERPFSAPLTLGPNGEIIFVFYGYTFFVYNPRANVFRFPKVCCYNNSQHVYVESLVSPEDV